MFSGSPVHDSLGIFVLKEELELETDSQAFYDQWGQDGSPKCH